MAGGFSSPLSVWDQCRVPQPCWRRAEMALGTRCAGSWWQVWCRWSIRLAGGGCAPLIPTFSSFGQEIFAGASPSSVAARRPGVQRGLLAQAPSLPGPGVVRCNRCGPCGRAGCSFQRCFRLGPVGQPQGLQLLWVPSSLLPEAGAIPSLSAGAIPRHEALLASLPSWGSPGSWLQEPNLCCSVPVGSWSRVGLSTS